MFPVVEIFTSIQGEGCNLGKAANFIRFAGCNLKCPWCDTKWDEPKEGILSTGDIIDRLDQRVGLVVLTGGEPLIQHGLEELIDMLSVMWDVAIETNGTQPTKNIKKDYPNVWVACSPKPETNWAIHPECVYDELKYVVDGQFGEKNLPITKKPIWLQPEGGNMQEAWQQALRIQKDAATLELDLRVGVQLHKIMEVR